MNKGFPNRILGFPYGWKNLGRVESNYIGNGMYRRTSHKLCMTVANIGKEKSQLFAYCPRCMVKLKDV